VFYGSWKEHLDGLKDLCGEVVAKEVVWQIVNYGTSKEFDTDDQKIINMVNGMCRDLIESAKKRRSASVENGSRGGRPKKFNDEEIISLYNDGLSEQEITDKLGCNIRTVQRAITKYENGDDEI
jgi:transposase